VNDGHMIIDSTPISYCTTLENTTMWTRHLLQNYCCKVVPSQHRNSWVVAASLSWQCRNRCHLYDVFWRIHTETNVMVTLQQFDQVQFYKIAKNCNSQTSIHLSSTQQQVREKCCQNSQLDHILINASKQSS